MWPNLGLQDSAEVYQLNCRKYCIKTAPQWPSQQGKPLSSMHHTNCLAPSLNLCSSDLSPCFKLIRQFQIPLASQL